MSGSAALSPCGRYRYSLMRELGPESRRAVFVMLNPSTADAEKDDPTIRRCKAFARSWSCGRLVVLNLFAIRATDPADMRSAEDPEGPENWEHFRGHFESITKERDVVVAAWGNHGTHRDQDKTIMGWFDRWAITPACFGETKLKQPKHPLYVAGTMPLRPYGGRR